MSGIISISPHIIYYLTPIHIIAGVKTFRDIPVHVVYTAFGQHL